MTDNMFDDFVRDKLRDHQSPVPQGLWEKIERKKDKEPKGGFLLPKQNLWATLLFVLTGLGLAYLVFQDNSLPAGTTGQQQTAAATNSSAPANDRATIQQNTGNNTGAFNTGSPLANGQQNNQPAGTDQHKQTGLNTIDKTTDQHNLSVNASTPASYPNTTVAGAGKNGKNRAARNDNNPASANNGLQPGSTIVAANRSHKTANKAGSPKDNFSNDPTADGIAPGTLPLNTGGSALLRGATAYAFRNFNPAANDRFDLSKIRLFGIDCPTTGVIRRNDWYLEVFGSPDVTMKSVKAANNTAYIQKKDSTETQQGGFTAGFRLSKSIGENLLVKTGVQYSQINERFDLRTENERRIITVITIRTVITAGGADSTVRDTSTVEQIGYRVQRTYNRYRSLDIPLLLSYEFGNEKLKFALNGGVILNLYSWYNGQTINDSLNVVSMNSKSTPVYKQNIGLGIYAGFSMIKPVSDKFDIFLEPYFRYNLSNMTTGSSYSQKFNAAGLSLGIRYKLKGQRRSIK